MKKLLIILATTTLPAITFAAGVYHGSTGLSGLLGWLNGWFYPLYFFIISLSVITIVFYVFKYAVAGGEDDKSIAKTHIIWGVIGLFIMVSIWGLVSILRHTFDLGGNSTPFAQDAFPGDNIQNLGNSNSYGSGNSGNDSCTNDPAEVTSDTPECPPEETNPNADNIAPDSDTQCTIDGNC